MGLSPAEYSGEELRRLLRQAKATQVSIQAVALWMLERRAALDDMGRDWAALLRDEPDAAQQVVYLYVANDALQVGVRKYGRSLAQSFAPHLVEAAEFVMRAGEEKVKRCLMKVVGVWAERRVVPLPELEQLQRVCAGKPALEPEPEVIGVVGAAGASVDGSDAASRQALLREMLSEASIERVLDDMPEVLESAATTGLSDKLQDLVSATISADLLSDRMFQLESSLATFSHACEAHSAYAGSDADGSSGTPTDSTAMDDPNDLTLPRTGAIDWNMLDQQVFDLDVDRSRDHVQQYRSNLEDQSAKREALLEHLRSIQSMDLFGDADLVSEETMDAQCRALERLFNVCCDADALHKQRLEEQRAAYMATQRSSAVFDTSYSSGSAGGDRYNSSYYGGRGVKSPRGVETEYRQAPGRGNGPPLAPPAPLLRRHSSSSSFGERERERDRYSRFDREQSPKRAKLVHSHSLEPQNPQWSRDAPSPRFSSDRYDRIDRRGAAASFAAVEEQGRSYGGGGGPSPSRYGHHQYEPPARSRSPPRYQQPRAFDGPPRRGGGREHRSRWDSLPDDLERRRW